MTGWDLVVTAKRRIGEFWSLTASQVYRELSGMAKAGLIKAERRGPRERQPYTITKAGRAAFSAWVEREPGAETIRFPLLLAVSFGRYIPQEKLAAIVERHRAMHAQRLATYEQLRNDPDSEVQKDPYALATLEYGVQYEKAAMAWFDSLPAIIGDRRKAK